MSRPMSRSAHVPLFAMVLLCSVMQAQAQDLPAGPGKETVAAACGGCHEVTASAPDILPTVGAR